MNPKGRRPLSRAEKQRVKAHVLKTPPKALRFSVNGNLGNKIIYLGLDTPEPFITPGKPFTLVHYFQVKEPVPGWKLFVHSNGPGGKDFHNFDHVPVFGLYPVTKWKAGEIVKDRHTIVLPKKTPYKTVDLYVGIWKGRDRLKVISGPQDGKNRLLAARIPVGRGSRPPRARPKGATPKQILVKRAKGPIVVDGKAEEADWKAAPSTGPFVDSLKGTPLEPRTEAKLLWDDRYLYVYFRGNDPDVFATVKKADDSTLWTEQAYEILIDADGDGASYIDIQVNPLGVIYDAYLPRPGQSQTDWQSGVKARVHVEGTLNKRGDTDVLWAVELAIPMSAVNGRSKTGVSLPPKPGARWRANLFRTDRPKAGALKAWAFSPTRRATFHALDRFGVLLFADQEGRTGSPEASREARAAPRPRRGAGKPTDGSGAMAPSMAAGSMAPAMGPARAEPPRRQPVRPRSATPAGRPPPGAGGAP